jgi:hypothetical protein
MLLFLFEDEHSWLYEPHGIEPDVWTLTAPGGEILRSSGWKPYVMPRVSWHVHESLLIDGLLTGPIRPAVSQPLQRPLNLRDAEAPPPSSETLRFEGLRRHTFPAAFKRSVT